MHRCPKVVQLFDDGREELQRIGREVALRHSRGGKHEHLSVGLKLCAHRIRCRQQTVHASIVGLGEEVGDVVHHKVARGHQTVQVDGRCDAAGHPRCVGSGKGFGKAVECGGHRIGVIAFGYHQDTVGGVELLIGAHRSAVLW